MTCTYGSEKKNGGDSTITVYPYEELNLAAQAFLLLAAVPNQLDFNAEEICASEPPSYQQIEALELTIPPIVYEKTLNNMRRKAWFQGCQCKLPPNEPIDEPTPDPPTEPPELEPDEQPFADPCYYMDNIARYIVQWKEWIPSNGTGSTNYDEAFLESDTGEIYIQFDSWANGNRYIRVRKRSDDSQIRSIGLDYLDIYKARVIYCDGEQGEDREEPEDDPFPEFPDFCEASDCLKEPDKVEIITSINLHSSESNDRIRDEILTAIENAATTILAKADTDAIYLAGLMTTLDSNAQLYRDDLKIRITEAKNDTVSALQDWIDGAKNQMLAAVAASTASVLAGVATATTIITTAITASTTAITGAITTATTTLSTAINAARDNIRQRIKEAEDKVIDDLTVELKKGRYRYRVLLLNITSYPNGLSYTVGRGNAPDKYAFGWIQWRRGAVGSYTYSQREFVCNTRGVFISPFPNEDVTPVVHLQPSVTGTTVLLWSNNSLEPD